MTSHTRRDLHSWLMTNAQQCQAHWKHPDGTLPTQHLTCGRAGVDADWTARGHSPIWIDEVLRSDACAKALVDGHCLCSDVLAGVAVHADDCVGDAEVVSRAAHDQYAGDALPAQRVDLGQEGRDGLFLSRHQRLHAPARTHLLLSQVCHRCFEPIPELVQAKQGLKKAGLERCMRHRS